MGTPGNYRPVKLTDELVDSIIKASIAKHIEEQAMLKNKHHEKGKHTSPVFGGTLRRARNM